jgi:hypothetical protein
MFHVITLFTVPNGEEAFVRSMGMGGLWHSLAQQIAPDLIATDLLRHQLSPLYLCHDLWATPEAYFRGLHSTTVQSLFSYADTWHPRVSNWGDSDFLYATEDEVHGRPHTFLALEFRNGKVEKQRYLKLFSYLFEFVPSHLSEFLGQP